MLTKTLTVAVLAGLIAYASGALAQGPGPGSYNKAYESRHYSHPYGSTHGGYGSSGWSLSFSLGSSYGPGSLYGYNDRYYNDRKFPGSRSRFYPEYHPGRHNYIPYHPAGSACGSYGYHRH